MIKKAHLKRQASRLAEQSVFITALRYFFGQVLSCCLNFQICHKNLFINQMNRPQLKVSSDFAFYYKFIDSLLTDSNDSGYLFDRQVAGRFHYNSLPNALLIIQKPNTPPSHISDQIFTTNKNSSLK